MSTTKAGRSGGLSTSSYASFWGNDLRRWRARRKLNVTQLARYLGYARPTVSRWEAQTLRQEHPGLLRLALEHYDCRHHERGRVVDQRFLDRLADQLAQLRETTLSKRQLEIVFALETTFDTMQTVLADRSADNADGDADSADTGRWKLDGRRRKFA